MSGTTPNLICNTSPFKPKTCSRSLLLTPFYRAGNKGASHTVSKWWSQDSIPGSVYLAVSQGDGQKKNSRRGQHQTQPISRDTFVSLVTQTKSALTKIMCRDRAGFCQRLHRSQKEAGTKELNKWKDLHSFDNGGHSYPAQSAYREYLTMPLVNHSWWEYASGICAATINLSSRTNTPQGVILIPPSWQSQNPNVVPYLPF